MYIYLITNLVNGKKYVGQTGRTVPERWKEHLASSRQPSRHKMSPALYSAMSAHGVDNFSVCQIDQAETTDELDDFEELWIAKLGTTDKNRGYNISFGGTGAGSVTAETRAKLSSSLKGKLAWNKGKAMSPEHYENVRKSGVWDADHHTISEAGRRRISESKLGNKNPNFGGKASTPESIEKRAAQMRGRAPWNKGVPQTLEAREKMKGPRPSLAGPRPHLRGKSNHLFLQSVSENVVKQLRSMGFKKAKISEMMGCSLGTIDNRLGRWPESEFEK